IRVVFIVYAPLIGICALGALLVNDNGLAEKDTSTSLDVDEVEATPSTPDGVLLPTLQQEPERKPATEIEDGQTNKRMTQKPRGWHGCLT
ncbi:hypothetical protein K504DRAFT_381101, partial [Pleomassaria siparia CBS 279.74]